MEYSRLQPPVGVWAVLSPIGGEQALTPPKRHRLGRPLPYQLADTEQAAPRADFSFTGNQPSIAICSKIIISKLQFPNKFQQLKFKLKNYL